MEAIQTETQKYRLKHTGHDLYNFFTASARTGKIRSGQTFLYREGGYPSMVMDVRMKEDVCGRSLKLALDKTLIRYPYFASKMIEKDGDFYLMNNPLPFTVEETTELHSLGSERVNYHLIDVTYQGKTIYISYDHSLCDGRGIMPFVETLVFYYCTYQYKKMFNVQGLRLAGDPLLPGETTEPFSRSLDVRETQVPKIHKDAYALPDSINSIGKNQYYRYEIKIKHAKFMEFAKENNATPAIAIALLVSKAIQEVYPHADQPIACDLASDLRAGIGLTNTFKNCIGSVSLPYLPEFEGMSFKEQAMAYRKLLQDYKDTDNLKREINKQVYLYDKLDGLHSYEAKKEALSFFDNLVINTFILSYAGQIKLGDCEKYIDSFHTYTSGTTGLTLQMLSAGEYFTIDWIQSFETDKFINVFAKNMDEIGLDFSISDIIEFTIPKDSIRPGANAPLKSQVQTEKAA